jgi:hypothetical protein
MSESVSSRWSRGLRRVRLGVLAAGLGFSAMTIAQTASDVPPSTPKASSTSSKPTPSASTEHRLSRPGERTCLQQTGSLIPPKNGDCLPVAGRSYSRDELRNTGAVDNARALQMLDSGISVGH